MSENERIAIGAERVTRAELRKLGVEVIQRCQNIFPPGKDQAVLVAFSKEFFAESGLTALELRALQVGRNLTFVTPTKPAHGPSPFDKKIVEAEGALVEAEQTAGEALEDVVKARRAITKERSKPRVVRAKLDATFTEATRVSELYKDLNRAAVRCQAHLHNLGRARDRWRALRDYEREQQKQI